MGEKITASHLDRKAIVYIRQSLAYQVAHNTESRRMQYAMQDRVRELGWSETEVIDEDLGRSATGVVSRTGFERMVAEVCLGKVGAVAALELSRFARNSRDWQKLIEVCRVVDTLLIDQEAIYNPRQQRPAPVGSERKPERVRTGLASATCLGSPPREGIAGRTDFRGSGWIREDCRWRNRDGPRPAGPGGDSPCLSQVL